MGIGRMAGTGCGDLGGKEDENRFAFSQLDQLRILGFLPLFAYRSSKKFTHFCAQSLDFRWGFGVAFPTNQFSGRRDCSARTSAGDRQDMRDLVRGSTLTSLSVFSAVDGEGQPGPAAGYGCDQSRA